MEGLGRWEWTGMGGVLGRLGGEGVSQAPKLLFGAPQWTVLQPEMGPG